MSAIRRHLLWVLTSWLVLQFSGIAVPIVLSASHVDDGPCTCVVMDHATCPMHPRQASGDVDGRCRLQNTAAPTDILVLSLTGGAGIVSEQLTLDRVDARSDVLPSATDHRSSRTELPDPPPPRS